VDDRQRKRVIGLQEDDARQLAIAHERAAQCWELECQTEVSL